MTTANGRAVERYLPLGYFVAAIVLVMALLPTVLRPPRQPATQTAELSPDAPPDDEQQAIISALNRASSGTAGDGEGDGDLEFAATTTTLPKTLARSCPRGFGNPARQVESVYAIACAPTFTGNNGGATHRGVTADEIRVGVVTCSYDTAPDGLVGDQPSEGESGVHRTLRVYADYFNRNFQFYGRKLRWYTAKPVECSTEAMTAAVAKVHEEGHAFFMTSEQDEAHREGARRKMLTNSGFAQAEEWYQGNYPYDTSFAMDGSKLVRLNTEFMCKQLVGKPVQYTSPPLLGMPRVFGTIVVGDSDLNPQNHEAEFRKQCGQEYTRVIRVQPHPSNDQLSGALLQLQAGGVTDVTCYCPWSLMIPMTHISTAQGYFPEWLVSGFREIDVNLLAALQDPAQWAHAFGVTSKEMPRPQHESEWVEAYHEIDPVTDPDFTVGRFGFNHLLQMANAIQASGPTLTPLNAMQGLQKIPRRSGKPVWAVGGGYGTGDYTYTDDIGLVWWDAGAQDPDVGAPGAYRWLNGGDRFAEGEVPTTALPWFDEGIARPPPDS